jgi:hypothetical protein
VTFDAHREHIAFSFFTAPVLTSVLDVDPERVAIQTADRGVVEERTGPRVSFPMPCLSVMIGAERGHRERARSC